MGLRTVVLILLIGLISCQKEMIAFEDDVLDVPATTTTTTATTVTRPSISVLLLLNTLPGPENTADGFRILYDNTFKQTIGNEDSYKWTNPDENMAIYKNGNLLSIEGKPYVIPDSTFIHIWTFRQKTYYLKIATDNFPSGYRSYIYDRVLHSYHTIPLNGTTQFQFTAIDSVRFRFKLYIKKI